MITKDRAVTTRLATSLGDVHVQFLNASTVVAHTLVDSGDLSTGPLQLKKNQAVISLVLRADEGWAPRDKSDVWFINDAIDERPLGPVHRKMVITAVRTAVLDLLETESGQNLLVRAETDSLVEIIIKAQDELSDPEADHEMAHQQLQLASAQLSALT